MRPNGRLFKSDGGKCVSEIIVVKPRIAEIFEQFVEQGRVLFFSAPCGFGKTALADALLRSRLTCRLTAGEAGFALPSVEEKWDFLLVDDLQLMQEESERQALCALIREAPKRRFVLLSRGLPPRELMAFQYTGLMTVIGLEEMLFDREDIRTLFRKSGVTVTDSELSGILKESIGYPLGVAVTVQCMAGGKHFSPEIATQAFREVFLYFDAEIYRRFDLPMRRFLLALSPFDGFDIEMAHIVSGEPHAGEKLDWLQRNTTMLRCDGINSFHFWPQFRDFLLWELEREYTPEKQRAIFGRGGIYYELKEDYSRALDCYQKSGDHAKISELLTRNADLHPGMGYYDAMERHYRSLTESEIRSSPALMQGMSMLCSLGMDYEGSERWYQELKDFAARCDKKDAAGQQARSRIAWLDISLPQRSTVEMIDTIPSVFRLMLNKEVALPPFSVTSTLPSIMNGGKDFSDWSRKDDLLYRTMRGPLEMVLGRDGLGLADCALAESKFEKGEDISTRMLSLIPRMADIRRSGTPDIEFAVVGLLARSQLAAGRAADARHAVESLRERYLEQEQERFLPNIDALLCRIALHTGDFDSAEMWYRTSAPRDPLHLNVMKRYQYLTQAMVELAGGRQESALLTLSPLKPYNSTCARHIDSIHLHAMCAIARYRMKDEKWTDELTAALGEAAEYQFIRTISDYGAAILPLLEAFTWEGEKKWYRRLLADVRAQASLYPLFLQPPLASGPLTAAEMQILRLLCADKSNAEIGCILNIKLPTVKTHVSHILEKLGVNRRSEAKTAARRLHLIPREE